MTGVYPSLLFIFLCLIDRKDAISCEKETFHIRSLRRTCSCLKESLKGNCPLELQINYNCRDINLTNISDITGNTSYCSLDISRNKITRLLNGTFREWTNLVALDLSDNYGIQAIEPDAFEGLQNLRFLNLKYTGIENIGSGFSEAFRQLPDLIILYLIQNNFNSYDWIGKAVNHTRKLNYLALEGCPSCVFGPEFRNLTQLVILDQTGEEWNYCFIETLRDNYFENLPFLKFVYLSDCAIHGISDNAFAPLSQIEVLDLSYNYNLTFDRAFIGLKGLRNVTSLRKLSLNYIYPIIQGHSIMLKNEHVTFLSKNVNIEELHLEGNKLDTFEYGVLSALPDTIKAVNLRANRLTTDYYLDEFFDNNRSLKNLKVLDISYQHSAFADPDPYEYLLKENNLTKRATNPAIWKGIFMQFVPEVAFPPNLEIFIGKHIGWNFPIPEIRVSPTNNLKHIDLSYNGLHSWIGPVTGLNQLQNLSLAYNYCDNVTRVFFSNFSGLKSLKIQGNLLGSILSQDSDGIIFSSLKSLRYLNISSNKICKLPPMIFQNMISLEELVISYNMLSKWDIDVRKMINLTSIDMSFNKIETLPEKFTDHIDRIVKNQNVTIDLKGNPISCACENIRFLNWMMDTKVRLTYDNVCGQETKLNVKRKLKTLEKECTSKIGLITGCIAFIFLAVAISFGGIIYRYKWHLRYLYYSARNSVGIRHQGEDYSELYQYDSFISYADEDKQFVYNGILPEIEEKFGLRLCLADRDFTPGVSIPENIIRAISSSRRTVFVLSKNFLQSYWCKYELNMARIESEKKDRKLVVVVMYINVSNDIIPLDVMEVIRSQTYIEYPDDERVREVFWKRLKASID
ncbi:hypothetical protein CHS0354_021680 [Potamilus streckersoni]|uniref:TIR domain-containing protein n=1 Tax=Potamilus streckersoni TaxID=2493646 RepID=A0AAE0TKD0_9BIVA|nr:hypothetical protein CHS0354_021680 [Potamilus streckersoni]